MHGIVRTVDSRNQIREGTYKDGLRHGLHRKVLDEGVAVVEFYVNGQVNGVLTFHGNFIETFRDDENKQLSKLIPSDFNPRLNVSPQRGILKR